MRPLINTDEYFICGCPAAPHLQVTLQRAPQAALPGDVRTTVCAWVHVLLTEWEYKCVCTVTLWGRGGGQGGLNASPYVANQVWGLLKSLNLLHYM